MAPINRIQVRPPGPLVAKRANSLGALDNEFNYGPKPLNERDIPIDLRERYIKHDKFGQTPTDPGTGLPDFSQLFNDVHSIAGVFVLRRGLLGRTVVVTSTPQLIIQAQEPRGYLLLNPAGVVGLTAQGVIFNPTSLVGATTLASGSLGVANFLTGRFTLKVTAFAGAGPVTFDLQTLDPVDGVTWITTQTLFNISATGNVYANAGQLGIDVDARIFVTVAGGDSITFDMGFILKDGLEGTSAGATQTIFIGQSGVTDVVGYPILAGKEKPLYLLENVSLYAVTSGPNLTLNIFEL
jgi:hypothetical protein